MVDAWDFALLERLKDPDDVGRDSDGSVVSLRRLIPWYGGTAEGIAN